MRDCITRATPALVDAIIRELISDLVDHADLPPVHLGRTLARS
jgi:preprotein translocase subunit SecB